MFLITLSQNITGLMLSLGSKLIQCTRMMSLLIILISSLTCLCLYSWRCRWYYCR